MNKFWVLAATGALLSTGAMAQTTPTATPPATTVPAPAAPSAASKESLRQQMMADMQKAGFTDVKVRPDSFLVKAKDKNGTPVTMLIDSDSVIEVVGTGGMPAGSGAGATGGNFTTVPAGEMLSSKVVGTDVHNTANQDIGTIKDVAYSGTGIKAYIVGVGGFLGMGDHYYLCTVVLTVWAYPGLSVGKSAWFTWTAMLRAAPGWRKMSLAFSSVSSIWWTVGGDG